MPDRLLTEKRFSITIQIVLLAALIFYALFSVSAGAPLLGSDEYAYYISGKFNSQLQDLYQLDPALQRVSNLLYFAIIHGLSRVFGTQFIPGFRLVHLIEYVLAAWLIYQTVVRIVGTRNAMMGAVAFLLLPTHIYIYPVMPEIEMVLLAAALGFVLVRVYPGNGTIGSSLVGALIGIAMLIKPHAVAILVAALATIVAVRFVIEGRRRLVVAVLHSMVLLASCYLVFLVLWRLLSGEWNMNPLAALGLKFYGQYLQNSGPKISFLTKFGNALLYTLGHLIVVTLVFAPALVWSISYAVRELRTRLAPRETVDLERAALVFYALTMIAAHIAMTSWFSAGAGAFNEGEAMRLHGRYLGPALALFPVLYFYAIGELSAFEKKITSIVVAIAVALCLGVVVRMFKIYPWDNPLLFAFFNPDNWYGWRFEGNIPHLSYALFSVIVMGVIVAVRYKQFQAPILNMQLFSILLIGCLQTYGWIYSHLRLNAELSAKSKALSALLGEGQFGKGVVVSEERYGRESYILFGLANAPKVIERKSGSVISERDIVGSDWLLLGNNYLTDFKKQNGISFGALTLFPIKSEMISVTPMMQTLSVEPSRTVERKLTIAPGSKIVISLAAGASPPADLTGFNPLEEWGGWTAKSAATIDLPMKLQGKIRIKFLGWTLRENTGSPTYLRIGDATVPLSLSDTNKELQVDLSIARPSDRITIESLVFRPSNSNRDLGVAIVSLSIERLLK